MSLFFGEVRQGQGADLRIDRGQKQPTGLAALLLHKPIQEVPLIPRVHHRSGAATAPSPHPAYERFESNTVLVLTKAFKRGFWIRLVPLARLHRSAHAADAARGSLCPAVASNPSPDAA